MGISAGNKKMVGGHFISDIIDSDVLKILLGTREVFSAYVLVWKTKTFSYTGTDQVFEVPEDCNMTIECWGAGSNNASGGYAKGVIPVTKGQKLSFMIGGNGGRTNDGTTYGFGGSTTYGGRGGGGLSGVFTGDTAIGANDASRVLVIAGGAGGGRTGGGAGGGETGQNGNGGSYGYPGAGGTQTGRGNGGNTRSEQFRGGGGSGTYGFGGGGGWRGGNGSGGDGSGDDDAQAGGGSGYVLSSATDRVLTQGGGSAAGQDGSIKIRYLVKERPQPTPKARLPHEYQEVEYIQSDGGCKINTGVIASQDIRILLDFDLLGYQGPDVIMGTSVSQWSWVAPLAYNDTPSLDFFAAGSKGSTAYAQFPTNNGRSSLDFSLTSITLNDNTQQVNLITESYEITLFHGATKGGHGKIRSCKIYNGENLVRDLVPCYRVSDGTIGLYDLVEGKFYTNSGTGTFKKGASVNVWQMPEGYTELAYIESTGTQWIDTGHKPTSSTKAQIEYMNTEYTGKVIFGMNVNDNSDWRFFNAYESGSSTINNGRPVFDFNNSRLEGSNGTLLTNVIYELELGNYYVKDLRSGTNILSGNAISGYTGGSNITLNYNANDGGISKNKRYYVKIYEDNVLIMDFVPCIRDSDGVIGMYDLVTKQFFTNSGTGDFVAGPIVMRDGFKLSQNTIAHLLLDGNTDYEGSGITGTNPGSDIMYETVSGEIQAIRFKGNKNSFLGLIGVPEMNTDFTIGFWIKQYSAGTAQIFVERGTSNTTNCDLHYIMRATNKIDLGFYANDCAGNTAISASTWYHLCATYKYSTREMKTYINAVADGTLTGSGNPSFGTGPLYLGCKKSYEGNSPSNAAMSDFFRENKVWSQEQIQQYVRGVEWKY